MGIVIQTSECKPFVRAYSVHYQSLNGMQIVALLKPFREISSCEGGASCLAELMASLHGYFVKTISLDCVAPSDLIHNSFHARK